ncbi:MAG: NAD(P)-binding domain-containing protein [Trichodesmium sp. MO_231.B1]|nr:NAD(P)-binding domain-containing protein [Trichodesmium sp. MO_231.B1]
MTETKRAIVVGAGSSGLIAAKELSDIGLDLTILEKEATLGGVWHKYCWKTSTLTSSKWMTEYGCYPAPSEYADFMKPEEMMEYLSSFTKHYGLEDKVHFGVEVKSIARSGDGKYDVITDKETYSGYDYVVISTGLHGKPVLREVPGLDKFTGTIMHGFKYKDPEEFRGKKVVCMGLGESGIGISSEISSVAAKTVVAAGAFNFAPRVYPYTNKPFDQIQFWPIGQYIKDYQELLTVQMSWITRLPEPLRTAYAKRHPWLQNLPKEWLPTAYIPNYWAGKYWPKPNSNFGDVSGNLTRPSANPDDIIYLVQSGKITAKGKVQRFDETGAYFPDGSREEVDMVVANTGFKPGAALIEFPDNWQYRHQELYKGCFHPDMPNLGFVGFVRPTVGSIPAMAEMQSRLVAQVFSGECKLPEKEELRTLIKKEADDHAKKNPKMTERWPHVYFFDQWMEDIAELLGTQPKIWQHLGSWKQLQGFLLGAPMPLRFRQYGTGAVPGARERYAERINQVYGSRPQSNLLPFLTISLLFPYIISLIVSAICFWGANLSPIISIASGLLFYTLYMTVDLFRFVVGFLPLTLPSLIALGQTLPWQNYDNDTMMPLISFPEENRLDYTNPRVFENDGIPKGELLDREMAAKS